MDLRPRTELTATADRSWWQSRQSKAVLDSLRWLIHGNRNLPDKERFWTAGERSTQEWNDRYLAVLKDLEGWRPDDGESIEDTYHMKAITYARLVELLPAGERRVNAMRTLLVFLDQSYGSIENHSEWFVHVRELLASAPEDLQDEALRARSPIISLYARLRRLGVGLDAFVQ